MSVSGGRLNVQWREDAAVSQHYDAHKSAHWAGIELRDLLLARAHVDTYVQAVAVVWGDFVERKQQVNDVWLVHGDELVSWLEAQRMRRVHLPRVIDFFDEACANGLPS